MAGLGDFDTSTTARASSDGCTEDDLFENLVDCITVSYSGQVWTEQWRCG